MTSTARRMTGIRLTAMRLIGLLAATFVALAGLTAVPDSAHAATARATTTRVVSCSSLPGSGTYADPLRIGAVTQPTVVVNCPALSAGWPYNTKYFGFSLPRTPSTGSWAMTYFRLARPSNQSYVSPAIDLGPQVVRQALFAQYYNDGTWEGQAQYLYGLPASGNYRLVAQKLSSALAYLTSAPYNILITP